MAAPGVADEVQKRAGAYWRELVFSRLLPALFFSIFLARQLLFVWDGLHWVRNPYDYLFVLQQLLALAYFTMLVVLYTTRLPKRGTDHRAAVVFVAFTGTFSAIVAPFLPAGGHRVGLVVAADLLATFGLAYSVWGLAYLRRSFSIIPEARRLVTGGPYSLSRHPPSRLPGRDRGRHRDQPRHSRLAGGAGRPLFHSVRAPPHPLGGGRACARLPERLSRLRPPRGALPSQPVQGTQLIGRLRLTERLSARTLLLGGVMIVTLSLFISSEQDPDFWWHLRTGRWMLDNGRLPSVDLYTFTVPSHVWTDHEYLTEILMWLVYQSTGVIGLSLAFGLLTWAGFSVMYRQVRRQPWVIVALGLAIGAIAGAPIWGPRAQMIPFFLPSLELYWLQAYLAGRSRT